MMYSKLPIVLLGIMEVVRSRTRFQRLAFICDHEIYSSDNRNYDDWKPNYFGPFSRNLSLDIKNCVKEKIFVQREIVHPSTHDLMTYYSLSDSGTELFKKINVDIDLQRRILKILYKFHIQKTNYDLVNYVIKKYPEFTQHNIIDKQIDGEIIEPSIIKARFIKSSMNEKQLEQINDAT